MIAVLKWAALSLQADYRKPASLTMYITFYAHNILHITYATCMVPVLMLEDFSIALTHLNLLATEMKSFYIQFHFQ